MEIIKSKITLKEVIGMDLAIKKIINKIEKKIMIMIYGGKKALYMKVLV